jgi:hypothetical protein
MMRTALRPVDRFQHIASMTHAKIASPVAHWTAAAFLFAFNLTTPAHAADGPSREAALDFDRYAQASEDRNRDELASGKSFLWIDRLPEGERRQNYAALQQGQVVIRAIQGCEPRCATTHGGLIHDWVGTVFIPGVSLPETLATLQDYDRDAEFYARQVVRAKLLSHTGDTFRVFLRLKETHGITVVLDTEYEIRYFNLDDRHAASQSHSTKILEVENAGSAKERARAVGDDHGFLWRLYSYWRFYEADGGVYVQCNAISLTRDVPAGLGWMVGPFIEEIPRGSLQFTLAATRNALISHATNPKSASVDKPAAADKFLNARKTNYREKAK